MKHPASVLRALRERRGLTIRELHEATHIATGRLSMLERDMGKPSAGEVERLAAALEAAEGEILPAAGSEVGERLGTSPSSGALTRTST